MDYGHIVVIHVEYMVTYGSFKEEFVILMFLLGLMFISIKKNK